MKPDNMTNQQLADLLFPEVTKTIDDRKITYPSRPTWQFVTRFAVSPTWFLHIWWIFTSLVAEKAAHQTGDGVMILRIEDTDQKRSVEWAVEQINEWMKMFGIQFDEGTIGADFADVGNYWPYTQSQRMDIYHSFVKHLVAEGKAYPCWMSTEEIDSIREQQMKTKKMPGIYGNYSQRRNKTPEEYADQAQQNDQYVIRLRSHGDTRKKVVFNDLNREKVSMIDNYNDIVLIKNDWLPTYHLAHLVDDYLMGTTHVIRGEEWLTSVPLHLQLFETFGFEAPHYAHLAPLLKSEDGKKRKLSKRKDPETDYRYLLEQGYATQWIIDYLFSIVDSGFEQRQNENTDKTYKDYTIVLEKMNKSGALFDLEKLEHVNNAYMSRISNEELQRISLERAEQNKPELAVLMKQDPDYTLQALSIERFTEKDPKRFRTFNDVVTNLEFFYDEHFATLVNEKPELPLTLTPDVISAFVNEYISVLDYSMDTQSRFDQLKEIGKKYGFAANNKEFREGNYQGKIGELAMLLRIQLAGTSRTPDLRSMMKVMGKERVEKRLLDV